MGFLMALMVFGFALLVIWLVLGWSKKSKPLANTNQPSAVPRNGGRGEGQQGLRKSTVFLGEWILIPWLISQCRRRNPYLTALQEIELERMFKSVLQAWDNGQPALPLLRATIALAIPEAHLALSLVETLIQRYWPNKQTSSLTTVQHPAVAPSLPSRGNSVDQNYDKMAMEELREMGCDMTRVKAINDGAIQRAILLTLKEDPQVSCPITLDSIFNTQTKKIEPSVAALVQHDQNQSLHVYLYKKTALEQWFKQTAVNPLTRQRIDQEREFFILS